MFLVAIESDHNNRGLFLLSISHMLVSGFGARVKLMVISN
jgi:hypothetical protein